MTSLASNLFLWLWVLAAFLLWWGSRKNRGARGWALLVFLGFWALGTGPAADAFLWPLESRYPVPDIASLRKQGVGQVVVLTGGGYVMHGKLFSETLPPASAYRFLGGLELSAQLRPNCRVIFSGSAGRGRGDLTTALYMKDLAQILSPQLQAFGEAQSQTTAEHPRNVKPLLNAEPFVLVTSAYHMPRSMLSFEKAGLRPIPYPVNFLVSGNYGWMDFLPSFDNLGKINWAFREYLALLFYKVKGE